jgi:hypothetical protein
MGKENTIAWANHWQSAQSSWQGGNEIVGKTVDKLLQSQDGILRHMREQFTYKMLVRPLLHVQRAIFRH